MTVNQNVNASNLLLVRSQTTQTTSTENGKNTDATGFADVLANSSRKVSTQESNGKSEGRQRGQQGCLCATMCRC